MKDKTLLVFDVESIGLYGEGFAFGAVILQGGAIVGEEAWSCPPHEAVGDGKGRDWVTDNVPYLNPKHESPVFVRAAFWAIWEQWRAKGAIAFADCVYPVETNFLAACVRDHPGPRTFAAPYPLYDVAAFRAAAGFDPMTDATRLQNEKPLHDPLADARQSARLLVEALTLLDGLRNP